MLANEQVIDGFCWRHETTPVEVKEIEQWFLRITQYADALLEDIDATRGRMAGARARHAAQLDRQIAGRAREIRWCSQMDGVALEVFTTRIDTIYGVSALLISAEHPKLERIARRCSGTAPRWQRSSRPCGRKACARRTLPRRKKKDFSPGDSP